MKGDKLKDLPKGNDQCSDINEQMFRLLKYAYDKSVNKGARSGQDKDKDHEAMPSLEDATLSQNKDDTGLSQNKDDAGLGLDQDKNSEVMPNQEDARNKDDTVLPVQGGKKDDTVVSVQGGKKNKRDYLKTGCIKMLFKSRKDQKIKAALDSEMEARFFCMEVLNFLVSSSNSSIDISLQDAVTDLDKLKNVDWCTLVYERLKTGITGWQNSSQNKTKSATGCIYLLLVSILFLFSFV